MPKCDNLCKSFGMETQSNAFAKSMYAIKVSDRLSIFSVQSLNTSMRFVQVDRVGKKQCCKTDIKSLERKYSIKGFLMVDSNILQQTDVTEIGRLLPESEEEHFLNKGVTVAIN